MLQYFHQKRKRYTDKRATKLILHIHYHVSKDFIGKTIVLPERYDKFQIE